MLLHDAVCSFATQTVTPHAHGKALVSQHVAQRLGALETAAGAHRLRQAGVQFLVSELRRLYAARLDDASARLAIETERAELEEMVLTLSAQLEGVLGASERDANALRFVQAVEAPGHGIPDVLGSLADAVPCLEHDAAAALSAELALLDGLLSAAAAAPPRTPALTPPPARAPATGAPATGGAPARTPAPAPAPHAPAPARTAVPVPRLDLARVVPADSASPYSSDEEDRAPVETPQPVSEQGERGDFEKMLVASLDRAMDILRAEGPSSTDSLDQASSEHSLPAVEAVRVQVRDWVKRQAPEPIWDDPKFQTRLVQVVLEAQAQARGTRGPASGQTASDGRAGRAGASTQ